MGEIDVHQLGSGRPQVFEGAAEGGHDPLVHASGQEPPRHADAQAGRGRAGLEAGREVGGFALGAGGVARIPAAEGRRHAGDVLDGARQGPHLIERGGEGHQPVAADAAVGRLEPDHPA